MQSAEGVGDSQGETDMSDYCWCCTYIGGGTASVLGYSHITTNPSYHRAQMSMGIVDVY